MAANGQITVWKKIIFRRLIEDYSIYYHCKIKISSSGFPAAWKIMENLENENGIFQTWEKSWNLKKRPKSWKNHGISKNLYEKIMEKSLALHAFCAELSFCAGYCNCQGKYGNYLKETVRYFISVKIRSNYLCADHGKMAKESWKIMEKSWNLIMGNRWEPCFGYPY